MIVLLILSPTLFAFCLMLGSVLTNKPINFEFIGHLVSDAQIFMLALGTVKILTSQKLDASKNKWRYAINKWLGRILVAAGCFYLIAFALVAGP